MGANETVYVHCTYIWFLCQTNIVALLNLGEARVLYRYTDYVWDGARAT